MLLKIALLALFFTCAFGLIKEAVVDIQGPSVFLVDSFSFEKGGSYRFEFVSQVPTNSPQILLLIMDKGTNCDSIGKTCSYEIFKYTDICNRLSAVDLNATIYSGYPVLPPSYSYIPKYNFTSDEFMARNWTDYAKINDTSIKSQLNDILLPSVLRYLPYNLTNQTTTNTTTSPSPSLNHTTGNTKNSTTNHTANQTIAAPSNYVQKITTIISGSVNKSARMYFAILNCGNQTVELHTNYLFLNPEGEQLPVTEIPFKVSPLFLVCELKK